VRRLPQLHSDCSAEGLADDNMTLEFDATRVPDDRTVWQTNSGSSNSSLKPMKAVSFLCAENLPSAIFAPVRGNYLHSNVVHIED
jgi:hypothetical protein